MTNNNTPAVIDSNANSIGEFTAKRIDAIGTVKELSPLTFTSDMLTEYANRLALSIATTGAKSNETAAILYCIDRDDSYKLDGFNSLPDFVKAAGLNTANDASGIYKLVKAGALLMSPNEDIACWASTCNTTALSIIGTLNHDDIEKAIQSGKLSDRTSVKDAKDFVKSVKADKNGGVKVVKCYDYSLTWYSGKGPMVTTRENVPGVDALPESGAYNFTKVPVPAGMSADLTAAYVGTPKEANNVDHGLFMVYAKPHKAKQERKADKPLDLSSLDLSSMDPAQLAQLAAMLKAATEQA